MPGCPPERVTLLMTLAIAALLAWDARRLRGLWSSAASPPAAAPDVDERLWGSCGAAILAYYGAVCALSGGVYRPRGAELDNPLFYSLPLLLVFPAVTYLLERRARR